MSSVCRSIAKFGGAEDYPGHDPVLDDSRPIGLRFFYSILSRRVHKYRNFGVVDSSILVSQIFGETCPPVHQLALHHRLPDCGIPRLQLAQLLSAMLLQCAQWMFLTHCNSSKLLLLMTTRMINIPAATLLTCDRFRRPCVITLLLATRSISLVPHAVSIRYRPDHITITIKKLVAHAVKKFLER